MDKQSSPINRFLIDLADKVYAAMKMELERRALEEKVTRSMVCVSGGPFNWHVPHECGLSIDLEAIERERTEASSHFQQFQLKFDCAVDDIMACQNHSELSISTLEGFYAPDDLDGLMKYARSVGVWMEDNRKDLVEWQAHKEAILREKEDKDKEERELLEDVLNIIESNSISNYALRTQARLDALQINRSDAGRRLQNSSRQSHLCGTYGFEFRQVHEGLVKFYESIPSCANRATLLKNNLGEMVTKHQLIQLDQSSLQAAVEQIVMEEFQALFASFYDELSTQMDETNRKACTLATETLTDANKLACKLMVNSLGCDLENGAAGWA